MGPFEQELRALIERDAASGTRMGGLFVDPTKPRPDAETLAREVLAMRWAIERGHSAGVECLDGWIGWERRKETGWRRHLRVDWHRLPAWIGDRFRWLGMKRRVWRDRLMGIRNPIR